VDREQIQQTLKRSKSFALLLLCFHYSTTLATLQLFCVSNSTFRLFLEPARVDCMFSVLLKSVPFKSATAHKQTDVLAGNKFIVC